jgi:1,2-diacylglycerol 3-beta-glucosyltransferase
VPQTFLPVLTVADRALALAGLPAAGASLYLATLASRKAALPSLNQQAGKRAVPLFVAVVVPAHNERVSIEATVQSLLATQYPTDRRRFVVVADNCSDNTAALAQAAGAEVWERTNIEKRGKGYALEFAFERLLADAETDVIVVVDADTLVSSNLLTACSNRIGSGEEAVQVDYQVRNVESSWRTRLLHIAFTAFHDVRSSGRESFGLSCGLRGNGMAFSRSTLQRVPHSAFSIVEDLEYGIALAEAGIRIAYAGEASVAGEMPDDAKSSESQRSRWEGGRALIRRRDGRRLAWASIRRRDKVLADIAADLFIPPLGQLSSSLVVGAVLSTTLSVFGPKRLTASPWVFGVGILGLGVHVGEAWRRSGAGLRGALDMARVPLYVGWKFSQKLKTRKQGSVPAEWVRTTRSAEHHEAEHHEAEHHEARQYDSLGSTQLKEGSQ